MANFGLGRRREGAAENQSAGLLGLVSEHAPVMLPGAAVEADSGDLLVPVGEGRARVATGRLIEHALSQPEAARPEIVRRWLAEVAGELRAAPAADTDIAVPPLAALRLRVMPAWEPAALFAVTSSPVPLTFDALVVYPGRDRWDYLPAAHAATFGGEVEAAGAAAGQTIAAELLDVDVRDHEVAGYPLRMIAKDGCPFVTTVLLSLRRFLPIPTDDALVITPRYSTVALFPLTAKSEIRLAAVLAGVASDLYENASDPCSTEVYWWHDGTFYRLGIDGDGTADIPAELADAVSVLH